MLNKVLVVEDEQILAQNLQSYLEAKSLDVRVANDGAGAIDLAQGFGPDVVVLDFRLPDMEGFQVLDAVRKQKECHFILITGHPTSEVCGRATDLGVSHILFKPFPLAELARAVCDLLGNERRPTNKAVQAAGFIERRHSPAEKFPLQLYDGTWVHSDRRSNRQTASPQSENVVFDGEEKL
ncbi:response regulator [Pseudomonas sp. NPDC090202]|uniref:response regulator n=1 Tax=unclassified Pseudomonas TaxID=196821 RepID=UPI00382FBBA6